MMTMAAPIYHTSVLLHEAVSGLSIKPEGVYVDATMGGGGHTRAILNKLGAEGKLLCMDQDADSWENAPDDSRVVLIKENFRYLKRFLRYYGIHKVDGILADLGVSSHQFDTGERGFSTRFDGPNDMRMDKRQEKDAAYILQTYSEEQLHKLFEQYGEVRNSRELARRITEQRGKQNLVTTGTLKSLLTTIAKGPTQKYMAQVFQAIRMAVNDEMGALKELMEQAVQCLKPGGRLCVITFHSIEDRMVKQMMKGDEGERDLITGATTNTKEFKIVTAKPIEPTGEELHHNPRARSARLRIAEKI